MQEALRKTVQLLRGYPALFLPFAIASWINFYLEWFQKAATHYILHRFLVGHSVLGFYVPEPDPTHEYVRRGMMLLLPFGLAMRVLIFSMLLAAFVLTARLVRAACAQQQLGWKSALLDLRARCWRIIGLSALLLVLFFGTMILVSWCANLGVVSTLREHYSFRTITLGLTTLDCVFLAWVLMPLALKLIADQWCWKAPAAILRPARIAAVAVVVISMFVTALLTDATPHINFLLEDIPLVRDHVVWPLIGILLNLPLGLLWIFLGVLQFNELAMAEIPSPS